MLLAAKLFLAAFARKPGGVRRAISGVLRTTVQSALSAVTMQLELPPLAATARTGIGGHVRK